MSNARNGPRDPETKELAADAWNGFREQLGEFSELTDISQPMLDGIVYEFVHAVKEGGRENGKVIVKQRAFIGKVKPDERSQYDKLISIFNEIKKHK